MDIFLGLEWFFYVEGVPPLAREDGFSWRSLLVLTDNSLIDFLHDNSSDGHAGIGDDALDSPVFFRNLSAFLRFYGWRVSPKSFALI